MSLTLCLASMAPRVYGAQKGADEAALSELEAEWRIIASCLRKPSDSTPASGPAPGPRAVWGCAYRLYRRHAASGH